VYAGQHDRGKTFLSRFSHLGTKYEICRPEWIGSGGQALLNALPDATLIVNRNGRIEAANLQAEALFGYQRDELVGRSVELLIPARLCDEHARHRDGLFNDQSVRTRNVRFDFITLRKDMTEVPVELSLSLLTNEDGTFVVTVIRDTTDRSHEEGLKVLNAVLRESEERFSRIHSGSTQEFCDRVHPEDRARLQEALHFAKGNKSEPCEQFRAVWPDGKVHWLQSAGSESNGANDDLEGNREILVEVTGLKLSEVTAASVSRKLIEAQEQERTRIARDLHDDFCQRLAMLCIGLGQLWKTLPVSDVEDRARVQKLLSETNELSSDLHSLSRHLHSDRLEHVGLVSALAGLCQEIGEKYKIEVQFIGCDVRHNIPKDAALCLFRLAQEALVNLAKHSQALHAHVVLGANATGVSLRIKDDGRGFDIEATKAGPGIGLACMRERVRLVSGRLSINSRLMIGTEIFVQVPLSDSKEEVRS
jgi:PAS domain S-box-containing protein